MCHTHSISVEHGADEVLRQAVTTTTSKTTGTTTKTPTTTTTPTTSSPPPPTPPSPAILLQLLNQLQIQVQSKNDNTNKIVKNDSRVIIASEILFNGILHVKIIIFSADVQQNIGQMATFQLNLGNDVNGLATSVLGFQSGLKGLTMRIQVQFYALFFAI